MAAPLIALTMSAAGHDSLTIGLNAAVYALAILGVGPFVPRLIQHIGAVPAMLAGLLLAAAAFGAFPFLPHLGAWFALRVALGVGGALDWIIGETWINSLATSDRRGRVIALYATLWAAGGASGPGLLTVVGADGAAPFLVGGGLLLFACLPVLAAGRLAPAMTSTVSPAAVLRILARAPAIAAAALFAGIGEATVFGLLPVWGLAAGLDAASALLAISVFAAGSILLQMPIGWLADHVERRSLLAGLTLVTILAVLALPAAVSWLPALLVVVFVWGGTVAGYYTVGLVMLGDRGAAGGLAGANAAFIMAYTVGMAVGPAAGGGALRAWSPHGLTAALLAASLMFLWIFLRRAPAPVVMTGTGP
ncbi:MAG: MFS transporter [Inquilinus sp.]|nr:MFS transporter [Inquilinus sp.]